MKNSRNSRNFRKLLYVCLSFFLCGTCWASDLRAPAYPLIAHDPYFSVWSFADKLTDVPTTHWTGKPQPINGTISIDGAAPLRFMGTEPKSSIAIEQKSVDVFPTRTVYVFANDKIELTLTFQTPALPDDIDLLSRPLTTLFFKVVSLDGKPHKAVLNLTVDPLIAVNTPDQEVVMETVNVDGLSVLRVGSREQQVLGRRGDDLRIDWGYFYLAGCAAPETLDLRFTPRSETKSIAAKDAPVLTAELACTVPQGREGTVLDGLMFAYDDIRSIRYFGKQLLPYWKRNNVTIEDVLKQGRQNTATITERCEKFDMELIADLTKIGGEKYARLCSLVYRQVFAANKIIAAPDGRPYMLSKENFSNGCIGTIDVLYPHSPFLLLFSPALLKGSLAPVLNYAESEAWSYDYAPHDIGQYPFATGQLYGMGGPHGNRMPVEESGNMLIIIAALAEIEGNAAFAEVHWDTLTVWADYLVREGFDPENQLCSADMFGHLAHVTNLSLKAIIGIGGYAKLCEKLGKTDDAKKYRRIAEEYAANWLEQAKDDGRTRLAFDKPGTWSMKHNLIWDEILKTNLFPASLAEQEIAWYKKVQNKYGLPVDSRTDNSLIDWAVWSITPAKNPKDFETLFNPIYDYVNETPSRVPLSDWFFTTDAKQRGFQARSVVGGVYMKMLTDEPVWKKYAGRAEKVTDFPSRYPARTTYKEIVPSALGKQTEWKYTVDAPPENWFRNDFDDSAWKTGKNGFGSIALRTNPPVSTVPGNPPIGTEWNTKDIWLRREFELLAVPEGQVFLYVYYDEAPEIWINGVFAAKADGYTASYVPLDITPEAAATLKPGKNRFAVKASQTLGGQYIDLGLAIEVALADDDIKEKKSAQEESKKPTPARMLFDYPVRDTSICRGPDGTYYLTGTTGHPTWWSTNEGIRLWKSNDLEHWEPLGLVWTFDKDTTWQKGLTKADGVFYKAIWAPEIHYIKGTFYIAYCVNHGGTGVLKSTSGKAEGPYVDVKTDGPLSGLIDASLFEDDDGSVYLLWQDGNIAKMNDTMTDLAEEPKVLRTDRGRVVGFEGIFLTKKDGKYILIAADPNKDCEHPTYDCMAAYSDKLEGPYTDFHLAIRSGGHNVLFHDGKGQWYSTFFGNDKIAPFCERPGIVPIRWSKRGHIRVEREPARATAYKEIVPTALGKQVDWKYTLDAPPENWFHNDFDDSAWKTGKGGFGNVYDGSVYIWQDDKNTVIPESGTPLISTVAGNPPAGTEWKTKEIWLRREFELSVKPEEQLFLYVYYDESPEIWINGVFAAKADGYTTSYIPLNITPEAAATLKPGKNRIAVKASQTSGGQYIDVGLVREIALTDAEIKDGKSALEESKKTTPAKMLFDYPVRDTSICRGPDGTWYLTGTTGAPTWWFTNEGIRLWKSNDLEHWEPLGLVWTFEKNTTWQKGITKDGKFFRSIFAPEIHYIKGTFYIPYSVNYGGTGLLKSTSGKAEGPYVDVKPDGPLSGRIDASLFQDDDGSVYFLWQDGNIAKMNDAMTGFAEEPKMLRTNTGRFVGFEGVFLTKKDGKYILIAPDFNHDSEHTTYDCMAAYSDKLEGPYTDFHLAIRSGGHNMLFHDDKGQWYSTFFGQDKMAPFCERPGIVPIRWNELGHIRIER